MRLAVSVAALAALCNAVCSKFIVPPTSLEAAPYAEWAHHHWVWLSSDRSNQSSVEEFVEEWHQHNITVGAIDIDSLWSTGVNNFIVDTDKFPDMGGLVNKMHSKNIKVILWMTSMIDTDSSNFQTANSSGYLIRNGFNETSIMKWWHGHGGLLDYTNPEALAWWNKQVDQVLALGIDGWKTDGTDPFIIENIVPMSHQGPISYREYADQYYGGTFNHTRDVNGDHCLIMSRPVDSYPIIGADFFVYNEFSPRYVMFSGWVGDQDPTFDGLQDALKNMFYSAWVNYTNFGSDIGGYRTGKGPLGRSKELFMRWFEMAAFTPLMENGGNKEHRPWAFDTPGQTDVTDTYRRFVNAHYQLVPFFLSKGTQAYEAGQSVMRPLSPKPESMFLVQLEKIETYNYVLGDQLLVVPVVQENQTTAVVSFPNGSAWSSFWTPSQVHQGGTTARLATPLYTIPVFIKHGSVLWLDTRFDAGLHHSFGDEEAASLMPELTDDTLSTITALITQPSLDGTVVAEQLREFKGLGAELTYFAQPGENSGTKDLVIRCSATQRRVHVRMRGITAAGGALMRSHAGELVPLDTSTLQSYAAVEHPAGVSEVVLRVEDASVGFEIVLRGVQLAEQ